MDMDSLNLKVKELLIEVKFDFSPSTTKLIDDVVSSIKQAIDQIPQGLQVPFSSKTLNPRLFIYLFCFILLIFITY